MIDSGCRALITLHKYTTDIAFFFCPKLRLTASTALNELQKSRTSHQLLLTDEPSQNPKCPLIQEIRAHAHAAKVHLRDERFI